MVMGWLTRSGMLYQATEADRVDSRQPGDVGQSARAAEVDGVDAREHGEILDAAAAVHLDGVRIDFCCHGGVRVSTGGGCLDR